MVDPYVNRQMVWPIPELKLRLPAPASKRAEADARCVRPGAALAGQATGLETADHSLAGEEPHTKEAAAAAPPRRDIVVPRRIILKKEKSDQKGVV